MLVVVVVVVVFIFVSEVKFTFAKNVNYLASKQKNSPDPGVNCALLTPTDSFENQGATNKRPWKITLLQSFNTYRYSGHQGRI